MSELENDKGFLAGNFSDFGAQASTESWQSIASNLPTENKSKKRGLFFLFTGILCFSLAYFFIQPLFKSTVSLSSLKYADFNLNNKVLKQKKKTLQKNKKYTSEEFVITLNNASSFFPYYSFNSSEYQLPFCNTIYSSDSRFVYVDNISLNSENATNEINKLFTKKLDRNILPITFKKENQIVKKSHFIKLQSSFYYDADRPENQVIFINSPVQTPILDMRSQLELSFHREFNYRFTLGVGLKYGKFENQFSRKDIDYQNPYKKIEALGISVHPEWALIKRYRFELTIQASTDFNHYFKETTKQLNEPVSISIEQSFENNTIITRTKINMQSLGYSFGLSANYWLNQRIKLHFSPQISDQFLLKKEFKSEYQIEKIKLGAQLGISYHF
ncbi:MAG: hypothetical protein ACK476_00130 [Fluviicola sp.]